MSRSAGRGTARWRAVALALLLAAALGRAAREEFFATLEKRLSRRSVEFDLRTRNRLRALLQRAGELTLQPPAAPAALPRRDGRCPDPELGLRRVRPAEMPSTRLAPPELLVPGRAVVSLYLDPCRLRRLDEHRQGRGREWEEPGWISVFEDGRLRFASAIGVRLHGRTRRLWRVPSFRFYFRAALGAREFPAELLHPESPVSPRRLVAKWDPGAAQQEAPRPFANALAYDLARRLGARAPYARPVALSVNGGAPRYYNFEEHVDDEYLRAHFGHADFDLVRAKRDAADEGEALARGEAHWLARQPRLSVEGAAARYDVDQLVAGLITLAFCGTGDAFQDVMIRDRRGELAGGRWTWVLWDLERSFEFLPSGQPAPTSYEPLPDVVRGGARATRFLPGRILHRLARQDPQFRAELARRTLAALDERLTPEFFAGLLERYRTIAEETGFADREFLARWKAQFAARPAELRAQVERWLGEGRR